MTTPHSHLRALALAAQDVPLQHVGVLAHFDSACSPSAVLALLDELERVKAGLREVLGLIGYNDVDGPRMDALRALAGEPDQ